MASSSAPKIPSHASLSYSTLHGSCSRSPCYHEIPFSSSTKSVGCVCGFPQSLLGLRHLGLSRWSYIRRLLPRFIMETQHCRLESYTITFIIKCQFFSPRCSHLFVYCHYWLLSLPPFQHLLNSRREMALSVTSTLPYKQDLTQSRTMHGVKTLAQARSAHRLTD